LRLKNTGQGRGAALFPVPVKGADFYSTRNASRVKMRRIKIEYQEKGLKSNKTRTLENRKSAAPSVS